VARPADLVEIELPYGRFLYALPIDRRPIAYAATRSCVTADRRDDLLVFLAAALPLGAAAAARAADRRIRRLPARDPGSTSTSRANSAEGAGFVYNPRAPVAGSTAPLWTLLLAAGARVAGASLVMVKSLGVAGALRPRWCCAARRCLGRVAAAALVAAIALLWAGPFAWGALSGMEVTLAPLLVAAALLALARDRSC